MADGTDAGALLRATRRRAGLTQVELARRAGVTQSVVSAYECGARQPAVSTLARLVAASGHRLVLDAAVMSPLSGPLGQRLRAHQARLVEVAAGRGASRLRVFGSVARGQESPDSDVDLLVDVAPGVGLLGLARLQRDLQEILGARVDLVPSDGVKPAIRRAIEPDLVTL
ncbi:MAG: nucleotidyltransferase domain-containing protein [Candidatus Limnocylindrales bacterium]